MAITSYSALKTAIADWLDRTDLTTPIDDFIDLAEAHFARTLRVRAMETALSETISSGVVAIPSGHLELRHAYVDGSPTLPLNIVNPQQLYRQYPLRSSAGKPRVISLDAGNFIFGPYPDSDYTIKGTYYKALTALDGTNTTNWLLANAPDLYLFRSLVEAEPYIGNDSRMVLWAAKAEAAQLSVEESERNERWPLGMSLGTGLA